MPQLSTAGRLLDELHRESATRCEVVASGAGILHDRAERARKGDVRLSLAEQLRLAEAVTRFAPSHSTGR